MILRAKSSDKITELQFVDHGLRQCPDGVMRYVSEFRSMFGELIGYTAILQGRHQRLEDVGARRLACDDRFLARKGFTEMTPV